MIIFEYKKMKQQTEKELIWIYESHNDVRYGLKGKLIKQEKTPFQEIKIIESKRYGKGLLLDNAWMTTEKQEKQYHECLVHPAICGAKDLNKVLIIGGGDGGTARECLKYKQIKNLDMVEIDIRVIELSKQYLPSLGDKAWNDSRLNIKIKNAIEWIKQAKNNYYDVIIVDGADPKGPAKQLFDINFLKDCKRVLKSGGIFATQSESPESFREIHIEIIQTLRKVFDYADPLYGSVPIYPSGWWSWTFASDEKPRYLSPKKERVLEISAQCEIWSTRWQQGAFNTIPAFIERVLKS